MEDSGGGVDGTSCVAEYGSKMVFVPVDGKGKSFCIDATEATNADYALFLKVGAQPALPENCAEDADFTPRYGFAADTLPMVGVDWCDAYAYCSWAGKRLCGKLGGGVLTDADFKQPHISEWSLACTNYGASDFPYGEEEDRTACAVGARNAPGELRPVGSLPSCEGGPTGVFDMVGNVQEWENATVYGNGVFLLGGSYKEGYACATYGETTVDAFGEDIGFRCCKDPE